MITITLRQLFSLQQIYYSHLKARQSKRSRNSLVKFEFCPLSNLGALYNNISCDTYKLSRYHKFLVYEPKEREIQTLPYHDRVVQHVLCDCILAPYFTRRAVIDNCVCQVGKGAHFAGDRLLKNLKQYVSKHGNNVYVLKCDILKFFPSIAHKHVHELIKKHVKDKSLQHFISAMIDSFHTAPEYLQKYGISSLQNTNNALKTNRGLPIGNQTSQIFGMIYLDPVDRLIKEKLQIKVFSRYMDDFILVDSDKQKLKNALVQIRLACQKLNLELNSKTQIFPLKNGFTYLGFKYKLDSNGKVIKYVAKKTIHRFNKRAKLLNKAFLDGAINAERVCQSIIAYHGHLKHSKSFVLERKLYKKIHVPIGAYVKTHKKLKRVLIGVKIK